MNNRPLVLINHLVEPPGKVTGITRYTFGLVSAMIRRGDVRIALATCFNQADIPHDIVAGAERIITLPHVASTPLSNLNQRKQLKRIAQDIRPDVVYAMNPMCPSAPGVRNIITVHDLYYEILPQHYHWRHKLWWRLFFSDAARCADRIACASLNTAHDAERLHPGLAGKTRVVAGAGVLPAGKASLPGSVSSEPYILLLGNVTPNKNAPFLIDALRLLASKGRSVNAYHVGRDLTGDLAKALSGDGDRLLTSLGGLDDEALDAVLRHARALVQPSSYEGFGLPIIEAQERGVPVVASDIPIFREVMGDGGLLVRLGDTCSLAEAVSAMFTNPSLRDDLGARARLNAERFTWDKSAEAASEMILELTGRS